MPKLVLKVSLSPWLPLFCCAKRKIVAGCERNKSCHHVSRLYLHLVGSRKCSGTTNPPPRPPSPWVLKHGATHSFNSFVGRYKGRNLTHPWLLQSTVCVKPVAVWTPWSNECLPANPVRNRATNSRIFWPVRRTDQVNRNWSLSDSFWMQDTQTVHSFVPRREWAMFRYSRHYFFWL